jgi:hypothetical protein
MVLPTEKIQKKNRVIKHKKRLTFTHRGKTQFLADTDLAQILGISERTARGYIKDPSKIPYVVAEYLKIVTLGLIPGCDEIQLDVESPGTFVTNTNLRFNEQHLMGYLWQMQAFNAQEKQVYRLQAEIAELKSSRIALPPKKAPLVLVSRTAQIEPIFPVPKLPRFTTDPFLLEQPWIDLPHSSDNLALPKTDIVQAIAANLSVEQPLIAG